MSSTPCCRCGKPITLADLPFHGAGLCDKPSNESEPMKTETKHTPGPWHVHAGSPSIVRDEQNAFVAEGCSNADTRLIAAAPELLTALEGIMGALDQPNTQRLRRENSILHGDLCVIEHFAKEAIAKAKGHA